MDKEYETLRAEIMQNISIMHNLLSIIYVVIPGGILYILENFEKPMLFIPIYLILIPVASKIRTLNDANKKLSTYMEIFLEPNLSGSNWETYCHNESIEKTNNAFIRFMFLQSNSINFLLGLATYILFIYSLINNYSLSNLFIAGTINTISLIIILYFLIKDFSKTTRENISNKWRELKLSLDNKNDE